MHPEYSSPERTSQEQETEERAELILWQLGLNWEYLKGKTILNIGAGDAQLEQAAKKRNIMIIPLDPYSRDVYQGTPPQGVNYIQGSALKLPFKDQRFDLILSHAAPPTTFITSTKEVQDTLMEMERVLKDGGEARFGPLGTVYPAFDEKEIFTDEERQTFTGPQFNRRMEEKTYELLQYLNPNIVEHRNGDNGYYSFVKKLVK